MRTLGAFIRAQRSLADLSLRELAGRTNVSNAYLSQLERGQHQPSLRVLSSIANALGLSADVLLAQVGLVRERPPAPSPPQPGTRSLEEAIRADPDLSAAQKDALVNVYRTFVGPTGRSA